MVVRGLQQLVRGSSAGSASVVRTPKRKAGASCRNDHVSAVCGRLLAAAVVENVL